MKILRVSTSSQILALSGERWDLFFMAIGIYTSSAFYKPPKNRLGNDCVLHPYDSLSDALKEWVLENYIRMIESPTEAETEFEERLRGNGFKYEKQVFFMINKNCYFLDFYLTDYNVAVEIDGGIHKAQKTYDKKRDDDFKAIGVKTIRVPNKLANSDEIIEKLRKALFDLQYSNHYNKKLKRVAYEVDKDKHKFDSQIDLTRWHHVDSKPSVSKKYIVLYEYRNKLRLCLSEFNARSGYWQGIDNMLSTGRIRYWYELPKNPVTPRIWGKDE